MQCINEEPIFFIVFELYYADMALVFVCPLVVFPLKFGLSGCWEMMISTADPLSCSDLGTDSAGSSLLKICSYESMYLNRGYTADNMYRVSCISGNQVIWSSKYPWPIGS